MLNHSLNTGLVTVIRERTIETVASLLASSKEWKQKMSKADRSKNNGKTNFCCDARSAIGIEYILELMNIFDIDLKQK